MITYVVSDPLPVYIVEEGGNPRPDSETPLFLRSEEVVFNINENVLVTGNFSIYNPTNSTINQTVIFPFNTYRTIAYDSPGYYPFKIIELSINGSNLIYKHEYYNGKPAIVFNITVLIDQESVIFLKYYTTYGFKTRNECMLSFITTTAKEWGHPIENAYFKFIFNNSLILSQPKGGDSIYMDDTNLVTVIERNNWTPTEDITITWASNNDNDIPNKDQEEEGKRSVPGFESIILICMFLIMITILHQRSSH